MTRLEIFHDFKYHPIFGEMLKRLTTHELNICTRYIGKWDWLSKDAFAIELTRWFVDYDDTYMPKHHVEMLALLNQANSQYEDDTNDHATNDHATNGPCEACNTYGPNCRCEPEYYEDR